MFCLYQRWNSKDGGALHYLSSSSLQLTICFLAQPALELNTEQFFDFHFKYYTGGNYILQWSNNGVLDISNGSITEFQIFV